MTRTVDNEIAPFDPEIERTIRQALRKQKRAVQDQRETSNMEDEVEANTRSLHEYAMPTANGTETSIRRPTVQANNFEIKPAIIQMIQQTVQFYGLLSDDPNAHIVNFLEICDTFKQNGVSDDAIRLRLFPFSLKDKAKAWLNSMPVGSITTWDMMVKKFLDKFFPPCKTAKLRNEITNFMQLDMESLYEAWERYKDSLRKCPHHGLPLWLQVQTFYNGLNGTNRAMIDAASGGTFMKKTPEAAYELVEEMAANNYQWPTERLQQRRVAGVHEVDTYTSIAAQLQALNKKIDSMSTSAMQVQVSCDLCGGGHPSTECQQGNPFAPSTENINYMGNLGRQQQNNPYAPTYNPGWKNHPNFSWSNNHNMVRQPPGFNQPQEKKSNLEEMMAKFINSAETRFQNNEASIRNLETQMGQMVKLVSSRQQGSLPSDTEKNPKEVNAITLRGGKQLEDPQQKKNLNKEQILDEEISAQNREVEVHEEKKEADGMQQPGKSGKSSEHNINSLPFPQRAKKNLIDKQFAKFLDMFKKIQINIPFAEALAQMPNYARFLKRIMVNKRRLEDFERVNLTEECSAVLQNKLPPKLRDPGSFTIPCYIGDFFFNKVLCDLGASINLMPYSIFKRLGLGEVKPTNVTLQLADRSITYPRGVVEDVLVKVDRFIFPADFVVLDMEEDREMPLILGRPFLATGRSLIDVQKGELILRVNDEQVSFNVFKAMKYPDDHDECFSIDIIDNMVDEWFQVHRFKDPLEGCIAQSQYENVEDEEIRECVKYLEAGAPFKKQF